MKFLYSVLVVFIFSACNDKAVPADILPQQKMEKILWELLEADEWALHNYPLDTTARKQAALQHYATIYQMNGVDAATFRRSYDYYSERPALLSPVLDSVRNRATQPAPAPVPADARPRKPLRPL